MAPFFFLIALFGVLSILGYVGIPFSFSWLTALRLALAGMFLLTASAHWGSRRIDLVRMVPPVFPRPDLLVTATGILEVLGALGLLFRATAPYAALALCVLLVALFPANIHAARHHLQIGGSTGPFCFPRAVLQVVFIAAALTVWLRL
jgi:uncharacterized membrane protein